MCLSFPSCPEDENIHEYERCGYSGHVYEKGDIICDDGDGRRNISRDDGELRGYIRVDDIRRVYRSKETSHFYSFNIGETVFDDRRGGYRPQTSQYSSHNPSENGKILNITGASRHVDDGLNENERGDSRGDGEIYGSRSQEISCY